MYDTVSISLHGEHAQTNFPIIDYADEVKVSSRLLAAAEALSAAVLAVILSWT